MAYFKQMRMLVLMWHTSNTRGPRPDVAYFKHKGTRPDVAYLKHKGAYFKCKGSPGLMWHTLIMGALGLMWHTSNMRELWT